MSPTTVGPKKGSSTGKADGHGPRSVGVMTAVAVRGSTDKEWTQWILLEVKDTNETHAIPAPPSCKLHHPYFQLV